MLSESLFIPRPLTSARPFNLKSLCPSSTAAELDNPSESRCCLKSWGHYTRTLSINHLGSVADVEQILTELDLCHPELIISGLPFASLPPEVQRGIVDGTRAVLDHGGRFRTFQYVHAYAMPSAGRFRRAMGERFEGFVRGRAVIRNVPPAYVLTWS